MKKITITTILLLTISLYVHLTAQTHFIIQGGDAVMTNNYLVLNNAKFTNNGTFHSDGGTVTITGDATIANSILEGSSTTTFYNLKVDKSANDAQLGNHIEVTNLLTVMGGNLDLKDYNLTITNTGNISNSGSIAYIKTSGIGTLTQEVGSGITVFPIGNQSYTPVSMLNNGTTDNFNVRVENTVYQEGTSGNVLTTDVVNATWHISEAIVGGSDATLYFQWNATDETTNFDRTQAFMSNYYNTTWNNGTTKTASGSDPYLLSQNGVTNFSQFIIASNSVALPVELLYFYGEQVEENVRLDWQTATEINNAYFDVEWSTNGITFEKIGEVTGGGTTNQPQFYDFLHKNPVIGENYYRLRQVDFDEKYEYTNTIIINIIEDKNTTIRVFPNPAAEYIKIESNHLIGEMMQLFSVKGQLVKEFQHQSTITNLSLSDMPGGTYFIKISSKVKKIIIAK